MINETFLKRLKGKFGDDLYAHSMGVAETGAALARYHGAAGDKASLAGLLHDYAKPYSYEKLRAMAENLKLELDSVTMCQARLLHAPVGAALVRTDFGITDREVLDAIANHTTGRRGMSLLEKIIYLADYIEPHRNFPGVETIRGLAFTSLERALLSAVDTTIELVLKRSLPLHLDSVQFRNSLLESCDARPGPAAV